MSLNGKFNTLDDIRHGARAIRSEHLDGIDTGLLCNTVLLASNSTRAMSAMAVAVFVSITGRDGLAPVCSTFKVNMIDVGTSVDDIDIDTVATVLCVEILVECAEGETVTM